MMRGIAILVVSLVVFIACAILDQKAAAGVSAVVFLIALIYTVYKIIIFLKRKAVEGVKKGISATAHGKKNDLRDLIRSQIFKVDIKALQADIQGFASAKAMNETAIAQALKEIIPLVIEDALDDGILTDVEQKSLDDFFDAYNFSTKDISQRGQELLARGALVRDLLEGNIKPRMDISAYPYKVMKDEIPIWGYSDMAVAEVRNVSRFEGGSQGVSIRVAKGVYWRTGKMAAQRVISEEIKDLGAGTVIITSHYLYYHVGNNAKRIKHDKVFNISRYSNAVVVHMDGASAKPLVLKTDDTWFLANILQNAQNWAQ